MRTQLLVLIFLAFPTIGHAETLPSPFPLRWALERVRKVIRPLPPGDRAAAARLEALAICDEDAAHCEAIGGHGLQQLEALIAARRACAPHEAKHASAAK